MDFKDVDSFRFWKHNLDWDRYGNYILIKFNVMEDLKHQNLLDKS